jgi:hypothetical protein
MGSPEFEAINKEMDSPGELKAAGVDEKSDSSPDQWLPPDEWVQRLIAEYSGQHGGDSETLPPGCDVNRVAAVVLTLNEEEAVKVLKSAIESQQGDYSFDQTLMRRIKELVEGHEKCEMEQGEWAYVTCKTAGLMHNWSPYTEVRAVTLPYDDPEEACESFRAYILGFFWVCVCTAVNTCKSFIFRISLHLPLNSSNFPNRDLV